MDKKGIEERKKQKIEILKSMLEAYIASGKKIEDLKKTDPEYVAVKNYDIYVNGKRLSLEERFAYLGFPRTPQVKSYDERLRDIRKILDAFVEAGGDVNEIDIHHEIYRIIKAFTPVVDGKKLTVEEKFALAGHPRTPRVNDMELFYNRLLELENFKDEDGYVDSYKKDKFMELFISYCSTQFDLPTSLVVCLLADQKLKKHVVTTDRVKYLKKKLSDYLKEHKTFVGIRRLDPKLYHLLTAITKSFPTDSGRKLTNLELIETLGFENFEHEFVSDSKFVDFSEELFMRTYMPIINQNNGSISMSDIDPSDNSRLLFYLRRRNETKAQFFARHNVKYSTPRIFGHGKRVVLPNYPYLDEMQEDLYNMIAELFSQNPELQEASLGKLFELKLEAVKAIYARYKDKIEQKYILDEEESSGPNSEKTLSKSTSDN